MAGRKPTPNKPRPIDSLNRVVLPTEVREALGVERGDYVVFEIGGKDVRIRKVEWVAK